MLSKVWEVITQGTYSYTKNVAEDAPCNTSHPSYTNYPNGGAVYMEITAPYKGNYNIILNYTLTNTWGSGANQLAYIKTYKNGEELNSYSGYTWGTRDYTYTVNNVKKGDTITVKIRAWYNNSNYYNLLKANSGSISCPISLYKSGIDILPKGVSRVWVQAVGTIYGVHTDNIYHGGIMMDKSSTATTGNITPGNIVGYIRVNLNGDIVKIPYYYD